MRVSFSGMQKSAKNLVTRVSNATFEQNGNLSQNGSRALQKSLQNELTRVLQEHVMHLRFVVQEDYSVTVTVKIDELGCGPHQELRCQFRQQSESAIRRRKLEKRMHDTTGQPSTAAGPCQDA